MHLIQDFPVDKLKNFDCILSNSRDMTQKCKGPHNTATYLSTCVPTQVAEVLQAVLTTKGVYFTAGPASGKKSDQCVLDR